MDLLNLKGLLLAIVVFVPLERLFGMHHEQKLFRPRWQDDLVYFFLNGLLIKLALSATVGAIVVAGMWLVPADFQNWVGGLPFWVQLPALIVLADIGFYSVHRLFHKIPYLWKFHAVHHSIEDLDWLAAHRVHPVDQILTKGASLLPVFALGFSAAPIAAYFFLYHWQSLFIHSNIKIGFGPLRWLIASPQFHHWHHANHPEAFDKNFAGQLSFLDMLFGTMHMPGNEVPTRYGTDDPVPTGYFRQLLYPFARSRRKTGAASGATMVTHGVEKSEATVFAAKPDQPQTIG